MRTPTALLLVLGTAGAGFLAAWLLFRSSHDEALEQVRASAASRRDQFDEPARPTGSEPPDLELPDSRVPVLTERPPDAAPPALPVDPAKATTAIDPSDPRTLPENSTAEMQQKYDAINKYLAERTTPIFQQRFRDGLPVHLSDEQRWSGGTTDEERREIYAIHMSADTGTSRDALPRWEYPDLYVYKDDVYRLEKAIREREIAEAQRKAESPR